MFVKKFIWGFRCKMNESEMIFSLLRTKTPRKNKKYKIKSVQSLKLITLKIQLLRQNTLQIKLLSKPIGHQVTTHVDGEFEEAFAEVVEGVAGQGVGLGIIPNPQIKILHPIALLQTTPKKPRLLPTFLLVLFLM